ncbi:ABC transporter permease [Taibaiella soli]|uniref:ABC transporter permease n=1 Tax=Taibaiella soli TaxID=1649169 RepID=A0A2W2BER5_9BACT|nr:ABC transporter permease [Taibaiella soli]PZF74759.1 ABC transporter permease [Taibaiella soli]
MKTIVKYVLLDLIKNKTVAVYTIVLFILSFSVLGMSGNISKGILSLLNVTLLFVPLINLLFSTIYFFNSSEFIELLLAQPVKRKTMLLANYTGVATALTAAYVIGIGVPVMMLAFNPASLMLLLSGVFLTLVFSAIGLLIFVIFSDKTKGIGAAIVTALFFTLIFDGLLLAFIYSFSDYPIDKPVIGFISLNPIDLGRILVLLKLDVAVMMGYSGALFKKFLGSFIGIAYACTCLLIWVALPLIASVRIFRRKNL